MTLIQVKVTDSWFVILSNNISPIGFGIVEPKYLFEIGAAGVGARHLAKSVLSSLINPLKLEKVETENEESVSAKSEIGEFDESNWTELYEIIYDEIVNHEYVALDFDPTTIVFADQRIVDLIPRLKSIYEYQDSLS